MSSASPHLGSTRARATLVVVAVALFLDMLVYGLVVPVIPIYSARLGATASAIGILFASYGVALLAATPVVAAVAPRVGRRAMLLSGFAGLALATVLFGCATTYPALIAVRVLQGFAAAASWTAGLALLADSFPAELRGRAFGVSSTASALGTLLGPPLGGALADVWGYRAPFFVVGAVAAIGCIASALVLQPTPASGLQPSTSAGRLFADRQVRAVCAFVVLAAALLGLLEPMLPLSLETRLGAAPSEIGLLFAVATVAYGLSAPLVGWSTDRFGAVRPMRVGFVGCAMLLPVLWMPTTMLHQAAVMVALGIGLALLLAPTLRELSAAVDRIGGDYVVAYAAYNAAYAVGLMIGASVGGLLVDGLGATAALGAATGAFLLAGAAPALALTGSRDDAAPSGDTEHSAL